MVRAASGNVAKAAPSAARPESGSLSYFSRSTSEARRMGKLSLGRAAGGALSVGLSALFLPVTEFRMSFRDMGYLLSSAEYFGKEVRFLEKVGDVVGESLEDFFGVVCILINTFLCTHRIRVV